MKIIFIGPCPDCHKEIRAKSEDEIVIGGCDITIKQGEILPAEICIGFITCETDHDCIDLPNGDFLYAVINKGLTFERFCIPV